MNQNALVALSVEEFVAKVASTQHAVPAGGSVSALVGACSAALLALACGILVRHNVSDAALLRDKATRLHAELLALVDDDARAYHAFLEAKRDPAAIARMSDSPLRVAAACQEVGAFTEQVAERITGAVIADVNAARTLADAARHAALDLAEANIDAVRDPIMKVQLKARIEELRA